MAAETEATAEAVADTAHETPAPPPPSKAEIDGEIARHVALDEVERDRERAAAAKRLGMRLPTFDRLIKQVTTSRCTQKNGGNPPETRPDNETENGSTDD